jgi:hypothetical protein
MKTDEMWTIVRIYSPTFGCILGTLEELFFLIVLAHTASLSLLATSLNKLIKI